MYIWHEIPSAKAVVAYNTAKPHLLQRYDFNPKQRLIRHTHGKNPK